MSSDPSLGVSPSLDPTILDAAEIVSPLTIGASADGSPVFHPAHGATKTAFSAMHAANVALAEAEAAIKATNDPTSAKRLRAGAEKRLAEVRKAADTAIEALTKHREQVAGEVEQLIGTEESRSTVTTNARGAEVRQWLRGMAKPSDRTTALQECISAGDRSVIAAVLAASPVLSGIDRRAFENLRAEASRAFAPKHDAILAGIDRLRGLVEQADAITSRRFGALIGRGDTRDAKAEAALRALEGGVA